MSVSLTLRCPDDLASVIASQVESTGLDKTSVVVGMLRSTLPSLSIAERNNLPGIPAIYLVWKSNRLLYIGRTVNLKNRFLQHHRIVEFVEAGLDTRISWFSVTEDELPALEASLIDLLEPDLNGEPVIGASKTLSTFRIGLQEWEDFKAKVSDEGSNASAVLIDLVRWYLAGNRISNGDENSSFNLDQIDELIHRFIDTKLDEIGMKPVDSELIQGMVKREVESAIADVRRELDERLGELAA